ncbi:MAG: M23 family metallopeptidase [Pseudomonadota bacterium]
MRAPSPGCLSSGYGPRRGGAGRYHRGVDLYTGAPKDVFAAGDGRIKEIGSLRGFGNTVLIDHGRGVTTRYAHLSRFEPKLRVGDRVLLGQRIARSGKTGNATGIHLHYEIRVNDKAINPLQ